MSNLRLKVLASSYVLAMMLFVPGPGFAESCLAPARPFIPGEARDLRVYAEIIQRDFEIYILDAQDYFRCLDTERARAFEEAQEVSKEYGQFLQVVRD